MNHANPSTETQPRPSQPKPNKDPSFKDPSMKQPRADQKNVDQKKAGQRNDEARSIENRTGKNEGEGNRTADREYREGVKQHLAKGNVEKEAKDAEKALDDDAQRKDLERAEKVGRQGKLTH